MSTVVTLPPLPELPELSNKHSEIESWKTLPLSDYKITNMEKLQDTKKYIEDVLKENSDWRKSDDYEKYNLIPGQQISYHGGFRSIVGDKISSYLHHYGIYIGDGLVYELAPESENKDERFGPKISRGISRLTDFIQRANNNGSSITITSHKNQNDSDPNIIIERIKRAIEESNEPLQTQLVLYGNCESLANYISYGSFETKQGELILKIFGVSIVEGVLNWVKMNNDCIHGKYITNSSNNEGVHCPCEDVSNVSTLFRTLCLTTKDKCPKADKLEKYDTKYYSGRIVKEEERYFDTKSEKWKKCHPTKRKGNKKKKSKKRKKKRIKKTKRLLDEKHDNARNKKKDSKKKKVSSK